MLKDDKLAELTEELIKDLMTDTGEENNTEKMDILNKAANTIIIMNRNDQEKIMHILRDFAKNKKQKETFEKLSKLVENLNYMTFYLYNVNQKNLNEYKSKDNDFIKNSVMSQIFNEDDQTKSGKSKDQNINKLALKLSTLNNRSQNQILSEISKKSNEYGNNNEAIKSIDKLSENLKNYQLSNIFSLILDKKQKNLKKKKICDDDIKLIADSINNVLSKDKKTNNFTEKLLFNHHKEGKINQITKSIYNNFDEESKRKTISYLNKGLINDKYKKQINKIRDSIMNKNNVFDEKNKSILTSQNYMITSLGGTELNDDELNLLIETFCKDLFNDEIQDINKKEDNLNLIANLIKELHEENQNKVIEKLENKPEAKDKLDLIENLREKVLKLRVLKDELSEKQKDKSLIDHNKSIVFNNSGVDDLLENEEDIDQTMTVEITVDDIGQEDLNEICQVFKVDFEDEKSNRSKEREKEKVNKKTTDNKKVNLLASSIVMMDDKAQKKITNKLKENLSNEIEKEQFKMLMEKVKQLNNFKKYGKDIKEKRKKELNDLEDEIKNIKQLNEGGYKNLDEENMDKLENEIINTLYNKETIDFDKNEQIKNYLLESKKDEKIKYIAEKVNSLSIEDKFEILANLENSVGDEEEKKRQYNKLYELIEYLGAIKELNEPIKVMENKIDSIYKKKNIIKSVNELSTNNLEMMTKKFEKDLFNETDDNKNNATYKIVDSIKNLDRNNQKSIIKSLREKADDDEKLLKLKRVDHLLEKIKKLLEFKKKVIEKYMNRRVLEKIEKEKKYGIFIENNDKTVVIKKPIELNKNKLNEIKDKLIEDLTIINEEENDCSQVLDKYLKEKENEKKIEEISDVLNSLDNNDKANIIEEIKNNFDNSKKNNVYNKFIKILARRERQFDNEKRKKQKETIREIEEAKTIDDDALLYSFIDERTDNNLDIVNMGEDIQDNNGEIKKNKWTISKGTLETEEIY